MGNESNVSAADALQRAQDPDHLLRTEPESGSANPFYWAGIYRELMTFKKGLLQQVGVGRAALSPTAMREVTIDAGVLIRQSERYDERLRYWQQRIDVSGGRSPSAPGPFPTEPASPA